MKFSERLDLSKKVEKYMHDHNLPIADSIFGTICALCSMGYLKDKSDEIKSGSSENGEQCLSTTRYLYSKEEIKKMLEEYFSADAPIDWDNNSKYQISLSDVVQLFTKKESE
jgi:hypothetical protein